MLTQAGYEDVMVTCWSEVDHASAIDGAPPPLDVPFILLGAAILLGIAHYDSVTMLAIAKLVGYQSDEIKGQYGEAIVNKLRKEFREDGKDWDDLPDNTKNLIIHQLRERAELKLESAGVLP